MSVRSKTIMIGLATAIGLVPSTATSFAEVEPVAAVEVDWRQFHGGPNHRGFNKQEETISPRNVDRLSLSWVGNASTGVEDGVHRSSPTVVDGIVYFGTGFGGLFAFDEDCPTAACDPAWWVQLPFGIANTPAVVDGVLYVGTAGSQGRFYAFDVDACAAGSCEPLWTSEVGGVFTSSPTVSRGVVYVGSQDTGLFAFDADGCGLAVCDPLWVGETGGPVLSSPAVAKGVVYVGSGSGDLLAFGADGCGGENCPPLWRGPLSAPMLDSSPAVWRGTVYVTSFAASPNSFLYAFDADGCGEAECDPLWRGLGGHRLHSSPAVAYGQVFIGSGDGRLLAYTARGCGQANCQPSRIYDGAGPNTTVDTPPMIANGVVYVAEFNGRVYAYPARGCGVAQCSDLWNAPTHDPVVNSAPTLVNGTLYVTGNKAAALPELLVFDLT